MDPTPTDSMETNLNIRSSAALVARLDQIVGKFSGTEIYEVHGRVSRSRVARYALLLGVDLLEALLEHSALAAIFSESKRKEVMQVIAKSIA